MSGKHHPIGIMLRLGCLFSLPLLLLSINSAIANELDCPSGDKARSKTVRIGVLYRDPSITGRYQLDGFESALKEFKAQNSKLANSVCRVKFPYRSEKHGFELLKQIVKNNLDNKKSAIHIVLGPTDSGVMQTAARIHEVFRKAKLPVISPVVATEVEYSRDSWLFTTNPDISARTAAMRTYLTRQGVDSIGILYQDNEYGLQAERIFRSGIGTTLGVGNQSQRYQAVRFNTTEELSQGIDQLISNRHGAIGVFATRQRIQDFLKYFEEQNHGFNPYNPLLFTPIDVSHLRQEKLFYVSLQAEAEETRNEIYFLSFDTTRLILHLVERLGPVPYGTDRREAWSVQFQDGLVGLLSGSSNLQPFSRLSFDRGKNIVTPDIYTYEDGHFVNLNSSEPPATGWRPFLSAWQFLENLFRRFGYLPLLNILLVGLLVYFLTRRDLSMWNEERTPGPKTKKAYKKVVLFNISIALLVYLFMVMTDVISWGTVTAAIAVGFGYPALLKSTFGKTELGRTIGVSEYYEDYLRRLHDQLMEAKYHEQKATVDVIAMTNSLPKMRETLINIYRCNSPKRYEELADQLDRDLESAEGSLEKRRVYANRLRLRLDWFELLDLKLVPHISNEDDLIAPDDIIDVGVEFLWGSETKTSNELATDFNTYLTEIEQVSPDRANEIKKEVEAWLAQSVSERGRLRCYLRALFMRDQFEIGKIVKRHYLPDDALKNLSTKDWWRRYKWNNDKKTRTV